MKFFNKKQNSEDEPKKIIQVGLEVKLPGCEEFIPIGKSQYNRIYLDDIGPRLIIVADEVAELIEAGGIKTTEGKEEDALKGELVGLTKSITQLGRSAGIHMVLAPLRLSTIIPTTKGYKTMETIEVGDIIFDKDNKQTNVIGMSEIKMSKKMYEITVSHNNQTMIFGSDCDHNFPILFDGGLLTLTVEEMFNRIKNEKLKAISTNDAWEIVSINEVESELVKCIEVSSDSHLFLITDKKYDEWEKNPWKWYQYEAILTHNTQRNDASIIPGVIQNNPLAQNTRLRVLRKIK